MIRWRVWHCVGWILISVCGTLTAQTGDKGCAVLFDNSGSMTQYFTPQHMSDAKQLVLDLTFRGTFDRTKWQMTGDAGSLRPLWEPGRQLYVHAFGELSGDIDPFFRTPPEWDYQVDDAAARQFIEQKLFGRLNFSEQFTHIELARLLSWWKISNLLGESGKNYYMNVLLVSDGIPDQNMKFPAAGRGLRVAFTKNTIQERHVLHFEHLIPSARDTSLHLFAQLDLIGPHFIDPGFSVRDTVKPSQHFVRLALPRQNAVFPFDTNVIPIQWSGEGTFAKYIVSIYQQVPRRKLLLERDMGKLVNWRLNPKTDLLPRLAGDKNAEHALSVSVRGVPSDPELTPVFSNIVVFRMKNGTSVPGWLWPLLVLVAVAGAFYWFWRADGRTRLKNWWKKVQGITPAKRA